MKSAVRSATQTLVAAAVCGTLVTGCSAKKDAAPKVGNVVIDRRTIVVDAQATGAVEPINVIEVKSKASGQITKIPVEIGTMVKAGQLLVQIDTRDVKNQYDQAAADLRSAQASLEVAQAAKKRADDLYTTRIITTPEFETAQLALTQAQGAIIRSTANVDLAKQRLEDATVVAPVNGTIIDRPVSLGQVIASATGSVSGGTTLLKMADLTKVRVRALVNETDIGNVRAGQTARVTVDAFPERPFQGMVEKIEPQAVVQQSVTMFPVIISLDNSESFLKPGMNGEVSMNVDRRDNVVAVSNDAVRTVREAATAATFVGLNPDSVQAQVRAMQAAMQAAMGGGRGGMGGGGNAGAGTGQPTGDAPATQSVPMGGNRGGARSGGAGAAAAVAVGGGARGGSGGSGGSGGGRSGGEANRAAPVMGGVAAGGRPGGAARSRTGLVFIQIGAGKYEPRLVKLGASNYDYSEVLSGLKEGDSVATLAVAALQAKRDQQNARFGSMAGGGVPGMQRAPAAGGAAAGAPAGGGGGGGGRPPGGR